MINKILTVAIIGLCVVCGWQYHNITILKSNNTHLSEQLLSRDEYIALMHENNALIANLDEQRVQFEKFLNDYKEANRNALEQLLQQDKQASDWSATRIPDSLLQLHKNNAAARSGITSSTGSTSAPNTVSGTERKH